MASADKITAFRSVPRTGVIYVTSEARTRGFGREDGWCNLGQGQPETGELAGAPPRVPGLDLSLDDPDYAPVAGLWELREAVADMYNNLYRRGQGSKYSAENVAISSGGRASLTRAAASLGHINLGHFLPDYTAYEELLDIFRAFTAIPILLSARRGYEFPVEELREEISGRGLGALLVSNPCNPTGKLVAGEELEGWVRTARDLDCAMLMDEFYSHYIWDELASGRGSVSAAEHVQDVDRDPIVIFDGLTKNWRYPGWRVSWTVAPKRVIEAVSSAGSFLDGGGSKPMQRAAIELLTPEHVGAESAAISAAFRGKRDQAIERLGKMGITVDAPPGGTFYVWGNLAGLPAPLDDGMELFRAALAEKVITVPGLFFDVNPGQRRLAGRSRFRSHARFSFGPPREVLVEAFDRLEKLVERHRT